MSDSKPGMKYENVLNKLKTYKSAKENPALRKSLVNQVRVRDGEDAAKAVDTEAKNSSRVATCNTDFINQKSMSIMGGIGEGKCNASLGRRMIYKNGEWVEVN